MRFKNPIGVAFFLVFLAILVFFIKNSGVFSTKNNTTSLPFSFTRITPTPTTASLPLQKTLPGSYHIFQNFNNCGPAALSMALSYYGISVSQEALGESLRPYQVASGINDDKSTTLAELAEKAKEYGFTTYYRPGGTIELMESFIANDIPVITKTWTKETEDIGHYRVVKGYDRVEKQLIQDDSLQGKSLRYSYDSFLRLWSKFNYEYVVIIPKEKEALAKKLLDTHVDEKKAWEDAIKLSMTMLEESPSDAYANFNLAVAYYHTGDFKKSVEAFEKVESRLPFRMLWYQIEPILSYYELGNYDRVFSITDKVLSGGNLAFSELYLIRGNIYKKQGNVAAARSEYEKAVLYNTNLKAAQVALNSL